MFGSVPLKTYLPDGDIDLALFQKSGPSIRNSWYKRLADVLEAEQRRPGPCIVRDVQVINAEVGGPSLVACCQFATAAWQPMSVCSCRFAC